MKHFIVTMLLFCGMTALSAEDGLVISLIMPPTGSDRFEHAEFSCWVPNTDKPLRAVIIHQHGCTNASPDKHPPVTTDFHWRALARKHSCALLVPMYQVKGNCDEWNNPDSGSERALFAALEDIGKQTTRPELKDLPWVLWGHSGGSSWSAQMIVRHPGRVLAASFRGGCHKQFGAPEFRAKFIPIARDLPLLFVWGKRETVPTSSHFVSWQPMNTMFRELREQGGHVARVIDPRSEHNCDDSRLMSLSFFDTVLSGDAKPGALVDIETRQDRELTDANLRDPAFAWMPNAPFAAKWREFLETGTLRPHQPPTQAPELYAERAADGSVRLSWKVVPDIAGGLRTLRIDRDGQPWKEFGIQRADYLATSRDSTPEKLRVMSLSDNSSTAHTYTLTFLDAAGQASAPSKPAQPRSSL